MFKRILSCALVICIVFSCIIAGDYTSFQASAETIIDYGLVDNVQYGQILQCWNWSFDNIRNNMQLIASQGFTAIQTSPIQSSKESTTESWSSVANSAWVYYQPISFNIEQNSWNALGTKSQFEAMCEEAHKYGVKVIVDTVFNHMANDSTENTINPQITSDIRDDSGCWNSVTWNTSNWEDRYDVTHNCLSGLPDLNTSNTKIQNYAIGFLKECIDAGADGFRFDACKHIETPSDASGTASDFWPNVLNTATYHAQQTRGITPYYYGELLGSPGGGLSVTAYTDYMSVTDNNTGNTIRDAIAGGNAAGACIAYTSNGADADKAVQWNESHDTYYADNNSIWISNENMKKTWAIVGSRAQICGLYLARPENNETTMLGDGDITAWADKEVKAINRFKNYFAGHSEYLAYSGNIVYNERGNTGVVLVNATGGATSVSVPAHRMYDGVYTDAITGNHFTVSNGTISGSIGDSGIAVVYSYPSTVDVDKNSQAFRGDTLDVTLTYNEATSGTYSIDGDYAQSYTDGDIVSVGCGVEYGEEVTLLATATGGTTTDSTIKYYKKLHPDTELTMYFDNGSKNWSSVYAYIYNSDGDKVESWPGTQMSYDSDLGLYYIDIPVGFETSKVVFNDGNGNQTPSSGGHEFNAYTSIYKDGYFYGYNTGVSDKLYFKPSDSWKSDNARFAAYIWNGSINSWVDFADSDSDGIFEASLPSGVWTECIFTRMDPSTSSNNWDNVWNRTGDMGISNNHNYFKIAEGWDTSNGSWSIINGLVVGTASNATLVGSFNNWDNTSNQFIYSDYKTAVTSVDLPAGTYTFKMIKGDDWFGNPGVINDTTDGVGWRMCKNDDENCTLVASGGTYTFLLDTETLKITVSYEAKEVETLPPIEPTEASEPQTQEQTQEPTDEPTKENTEETTASISEGYYLVGTINGEDCWSVDTLTEDRLFTVNPNNSDEYMLDYTFVEGDKVKVVQFDGTDFTRWYNSSGDNYSIGSTKAGDCTVYFRPAGNSNWSYYYFTVIPKTVEETETSTDQTTEESTESSMFDGYYLVGTLNGDDCWGIDTLSEDRLFTVNPNNSDEYMLDYAFVEGDEVKVVHFDGTDFTRWYNSSGDNYSIGSTKAGDCTVYFRPEGNSSWSYNYFTVIPKTVDETEVSTETATEESTQSPVVSPVKVENISANIGSTTVGFKWDELDGATKYWIFKYSDKYDAWSPVVSSYTNNAVVKLLDGGTDYKFKIIARIGDNTILSLDDADTFEVTTNPAVSTESITATSSILSADLTWEPVENAVKYWIYKATNENGPFYIYSSSTTTSMTVKRLRPDNDYFFKIRVLTRENGIDCYSDIEDSPTVAVRTGSASVISTEYISNTGTTASISWPAFENADKYWVLLSTTSDDVNDRTHWKTLSSTTYTSYTLNKLSPNTVYYINVCARYYDEQNSTQTIDYIPIMVRTAYSNDDFITFTPVDSTTVTLNWPDDITDVQKTWVYVYDADGNQVSLVSTTSNSVTIKKLSGYENYTYKLRVLDTSGRFGFLTKSDGEKFH